jgi:pimeloyl-ACP methyl ester carboxylesterase
VKYCLVYIPGLGDDSDMFRRRAVRLWSIWGVKVVFVPMNWDNEKELAPKQARLDQAITKAKKQGYKVSLVGESAGSTVAISAAAKYDLRIVTICGVNSPNMHIAPRTQRRAPALTKALNQVKYSFETLDLLEVNTITALYDGIVSPKYAVIKGAHNHRIFSLGHGFTITLCLTLLSGYIVRLAKK